MFSKKITFNYFDILQEEDAKNMFKMIPHNFPKYFSKIPKNLNIENMSTILPFSSTIKTCPGFINLYRRSILVTSPYDIYIQYNEKGIQYYHVGQINLNRYGDIVSVHSNSQFIDYINTNKYKFITKITLPITLNTDISLLMSQSSYHFNDLNILPGVLPFNYKRDLNFFIAVEKNVNMLHIKQGDPLFLMTPLCENKIKLEFKKFKSMYPHLTFSNLKKFILEKLT